MNIQLDAQGLPTGSTPDTQGVSPDLEDNDSIGLDFFNFNAAPIADEPTDEVVPQLEENAGVEANAVQPPQVEDNWEVRARYFQSEYDKAKPYIPIVKYIQENPQILEVIESKLANEDKPATAVPENQKPVRPVKPDTFNTAEAYADVNSESAKYLQSLAEYQEQLTSYSENMQLNSIRAAEAAEADRQAQVEYMTRLNEVKATVKQKYQATDAEVEGFVEEMRKPESINLDNLWVLYQYKQGRLGNANPKAQAIGAQNNKILAFPTPAGVSGGGSNRPQTVDANQMFNNLLRS